MRVIWLGHSGFRIETEGAVLLVDPWLTGNPMFPADRRAEATDGVTHVLVTHGHGDHTGDALAIAKQYDVPVVGIYDLMSWWEGKHGIKIVGFNKGGTVKLGEARVTMVNAVHSSSVAGPDGPVYVGGEAGFVIRAEDRSIYISGDTDVHADMGVIAERYHPDVGILSAGGHFTMDMEGAAFAARRFFNFRVVIPCHYRTFPLLEQSAARLSAALPPGTRVIEPKVLEAINL